MYSILPCVCLVNRRVGAERSCLLEGADFRAHSLDYISERVEGLLVQLPLRFDSKFTIDTLCDWLENSHKTYSRAFSRA